MATIITHEIIHLNSFISVSKQKNNLIKIRQLGLEIHLPEKRFLENLNEAVTEEMAMKFAEKYFSQIPPLEEDIQKKERAINSLPNEYQKYAKQKITFGFIKQLSSEENEITIGKYTGYEKERKALQNLLEKIRLANPAKFTSTEDIFKIFASATLLGDLPSIARLIEQNLGKGSFKKVAQVFSEPRAELSKA